MSLFTRRMLAAFPVLAASAFVVATVSASAENSATFFQKGNNTLIIQQNGKLKTASPSARATVTQLPGNGVLIERNDGSNSTIVLKQGNTGKLDLSDPALTLSDIDLLLQMEMLDEELLTQYFTGRDVPKSDAAKLMKRMKKLRLSKGDIAEDVKSLSDKQTRADINRLQGLMDQMK